MSNGFLITIEGCEGAGKTTLAERLHHWLRTWGIPVGYFREPGGTALGESLRSLIKSEDTQSCPTSDFMMICAARMQLLEEEIVPILDAGGAVLLDRYVHSSLAYQTRQPGGLRRQAMLDIMRALDTPWPDVVLLLDADPKISLSRSDEEPGAGRFEARPFEFHKRVRENFLRDVMAEPNGHILDATLPREQVFAHAAQILQAHPYFHRRGKI